ncbi:hypothetical protein M431DRAFT_192499 [Trichoderma harzianum CBS 226.95]|uniref:Uncharacterized protein n=1 Tax=Trichoderma harzianum CBS 226.95 TaxID=983964 RepID=A0A2T4AUB7_TRIHA|nr:hypothetical protein M431DRAFT_192499 [Trichoderma harzianum CBS 226.95]PTB60655.1 hypothetical protein M431DRAFT_192499 [Trichoderma harzianum CBS 226.95]
MPYYIWTTWRTMPPVFFPRLPVINAICPAILYLYCVFNYQLFKHSAATSACRFFSCCFCIVIGPSHRSC